jgi:hypothetical protein
VPSPTSPSGLLLIGGLLVAMILMLRVGARRRRAGVSG